MADSTGVCIRLQFRNKMSASLKRSLTKFLSRIGNKFPLSRHWSEILQYQTSVVTQKDPSSTVDYHEDNPTSCFCCEVWIEPVVPPLCEYSVSQCAMIPTTPLTLHAFQTPCTFDIHHIFSLTFYTFLIYPCHLHVHLQT